MTDRRFSRLHFPDHGRRDCLQWLGALAAGALSLPALPASAAEPPGAGQPAPDFDLPGRDGAVQMAALKGRVIYLDFWASWCGPCRQSFPWMNQMQARHGNRGLQVVGINVDKRQADADRFLAETPASFPIGFDPTGSTPRRYAVKGMPSSFLIGSDGQILLTHSGFRDEDTAPLEAEIVAALKA